MNLKTLIAYYSRTGHTKKVAQEIARQLDADLEEIIDRTDRSGLWGWLTAGRDAMQRRPTTIEPVKKNPANYDLVILGSPLWAFSSPAPAVRAYTKENHSKFKQIAFFLTKGGSPGRKALADLEALCGQPPIVSLEINESDLADQQMLDQVAAFCKVFKS